MAININLPGMRNLKAYVSHFRRPLLLILVILIIVGIALGVYGLGKSNRRDKSAKQVVTTQKVADGAADQSTSSTAQKNNSQTSRQGTRSTGSSSNTGTNTNNTATLANTGPGGYSALVVSLLSILLICYKRTRQSLRHSWRQI